MPSVQVGGSHTPAQQISESQSLGSAHVLPTGQCVVEIGEVLL
jgi:hypothetical protein